MNLVKVEANIDGGTPLFSLEIRASVNSSINAECALVPEEIDDTSIVKLSSSGLFQAAGALQTNKFTKTPPNATVNLKSLSIPLCIVDVSYYVTSNSFSFKKTLVSKLQKLDILQTYIYASTLGVMSATTPRPGAPLSTILATTLKTMIEKWEAYWKGGAKNRATAASQIITEKIHANNKTVLDIWYDVLESSVAFTNVEEITKAQPNIIDALYSWVNKVYLEKVDNFTNVIGTFCSGLNLMYIPPLNGDTDYGILTNTDYVMSTPIDTEIVIESVESRFTPNNSVPVTLVIVENPGKVQVLGFGDVTGKPASVILTSWPENSGTGLGRVQQIAPPPWLPISTDAVPIFAGRQTEETSNLDATATRPMWESQLVPIVTMQQGLKEILTRWAKQAYIDATIKYDAIIIRLPLDTTWVLGKRYALSSYTDGAKLFTGFLTEIRHFVEKESTARGFEGAAEASTILMFSHVEAGDFKLPNSGYK